MKYFTGEAHDLGHVTATASASFEDFVCDVLLPPVKLAFTREEYLALPKRDKAAPMDRERAKRVRYLTPAAFREPYSPRKTEEVARCNLIALDVDSSSEAIRLLKQGWEDCLGDLGFVVWHTASSTPEAPRLRVLVSAEGIPAASYCAAVRTVAEMIGLTAVTNESRVMVQPMYFPVQFAGESAPAFVASNASGEPFRIGDIISEDESTLTAPAAELPSGDLEFLRNPLEGVSIEDARQALAFIDPDCPMQQWIEVAAGLKHQFQDEGYALWDEWSAKGKKYDSSEETKYRWGTLKANTPDRSPVTIRSVFKLALARGWTNAALSARHHQETLAWIKSSSRSGEELLDHGCRKIAQISALLGQLERKSLLVALRGKLGQLGLSIPLPDLRSEVRKLELNAAKTTGLLPWAKGICYVTSTNVFYRHTTGRAFAPEVVDLMYTNPQVGDEKPMRPRDYLIQIAQCPQVESLRYEPAQGTKRFYTDRGVPYLNTYRPDFAAPDTARAEEAGEIYWRHMENLIGEPENRRALTDFFAYMVQHPGKKIRWAPILQGGEGCGKTSLAVMMTAVLGRRNVSKINGGDVMEGKYNDWAYGHQLVVLEEVRIVGSSRHAVMDKLKPLITDDEISLIRKYQDHCTVPNVANYLLFTNYHDALAVNEDGRRYFVLSSPLQRAEHIAALGGKVYFDQLYSMIRDNPGGLRAWFESWKISPEFEPEGRAPVTTHLRDLARASASPLAALIRDCIEDDPHPLVRPDLLSMGVLRASLDTSHIQPFSDQALASVLRELGWTKHSRIMISGTKHQLWTKKDFADVRGEAEMRLAFL